MTPRTGLGARLSAARPLAGLSGRRGRREGARRAESAARPDDRTPLIETCCPTWRSNPGHHHPTCHNATEETGR